MRAPRTMLTSAAALVAAVVFALAAAAAPSAKPPAPTGLTVTAGDRSLALAWDANAGADEVDRYQVYRNDGYTQVADVTAPTTTYTMSGLANGTTYKIRVGAHNALGYGPWSAAVFGTPEAIPLPPPDDPPLSKPLAPTGLAVTAGSEGSATITWSPNAAAEKVDEYQLYYDGGNGVDATSITTSATRTGSPGGTFTVRISAHNAAGFGPWGPSVTGTYGAAAPPPTTTTTTDPDPPPAPGPTTDPPEQRPFDPAGPVYQPMPLNAPAYKDSAAIVNLIVSSKRSFGFDTGSESPPVYVGEASDPLFTIGAYQVHVPLTAKAGTGSDYPLVILDSASKTEYRMWRATINTSARRITYQGLGVGSYRNDGSIVNGERALGQHMGTGSDNSYTVGMIRPIDFERGYIDHAIRVAIGYPRNNAWFWPALRTENQGYATSGLDHAPMGARIALRSDFDIAPLEAYIDSSSLSAKGKAATKIVLRALQRYGMIALDGTTGSHNVYFQGAPSFDWSQYMGPKNSSGSWNDLARALRDALNLNGNAGWRALFVADPSVFDSYGR